MSSSDALRSLDEASKTLKAVLSRLRKLSLLSEDVSMNARKLELELSKAEKLAAVLPPDLASLAQIAIDDARGRLKRHEHEVLQLLPRQLNEELQSSGLTLTGHVPTLKVAVFTIELRDRDARIWYGPKRELLDTLALSAKAIARSVAAANAALLQSPAPGDEFLEVLHRSYRAAAAARGDSPTAADGPEVHLNDVLCQVLLGRQGSRFAKQQIIKPYYRHQFSYDLTRLTTRRWKSHVMHLVQASRDQTKEALWLPNDGHLGSGSLFSHLVFKSVGVSS